MAGDHVVARLDRMPVQLLIDARLVSRASQSHAVRFFYLGPADHALIRLPVGDAAPPGAIGLIDDGQCGFNFHVRSPRCEFVVKPRAILYPTSIGRISLDSGSSPE